MTKMIFAALIALTATPALAQPPAPVQATVQLADLDLSSAQGQRALDRRLRVAVAEVCGTASPADLEGQNDVRTCRKATFASASAVADARIAAASSAPILLAAR